jgi:hypothetical protein
MSEAYAGVQPGIPMVLAIADATVGNVGTGVDDLMSYTLKGGTLRNDGDTIEIIAAGNYANTANNKQVRLLIDDTVLLATGAAAQQNGDWVIRATLVRTAAGTFRAVSNHMTVASTGVSMVDYVSGSETLANDLVIKLTGEATTTDDITNTLLHIQYIPSIV